MAAFAYQLNIPGIPVCTTGRQARSGGRDVRRLRGARRGEEPQRGTILAHKLMHTMIRKGEIADTQAASIAQAMLDADRAQDYTAGELASGRLGRVGGPD
jgi:hypothetical protein